MDITSGMHLREIETGEVKTKVLHSKLQLRLAFWRIVCQFYSLVLNGFLLLQRSCWPDRSPLQKNPYLQSTISDFFIADYS